MEVGKGGTLILPNRVCAVEQRMVCGVPSVKQDAQLYKMSSFCLKKVQRLKALLAHSHPNSAGRK